MRLRLLVAVHCLLVILHSSADAAYIGQCAAGVGSRRCSRMAPVRAQTDTPKVPLSSVGVDGGDVWAGTRIDKDGLDELTDLACSTTINRPIIAQYYPDRFWLWRQWRQTIVRRVLPDILVNCLIAITASFVLRPDGMLWRFARAESYLAGFSKVWSLSATMTTFTLSFFLSQSYSMWRSVYSVTRRIQGRLNDIGLLCATYAARHAASSAYTPDAEVLLTDVARYVRLFNVLYYASVTTQFAPLRTPQGLTALVAAGLLRTDEREALLASSMGHDAVIAWLGITFDSAIADGRLGVSVARQQKTSPIAVQMALENKLIELRATYASLPDELSGRMPLAYVQLVQLLSDGFMLSTPFALVHSVGGLVGVTAGTAVVTLFHSSIVNLAKQFLDPLNNEIEQRGGKRGIGGIQVATLLQQTNLGSERWRKSSSWVPAVARPVQPSDDVLEDTAAAAPPPPEPLPEPSLMNRISSSVFGAGTAKASAWSEADGEPHRATSSQGDSGGTLTPVLEAESDDGADSS